MSDKPNLPTSVGHVDWAGPDSYFYGISGLIHNVKLPPQATASNPAPAVVMVHGWGGDESVMWVFKQTLPDGVAIITPRAPIDLGNEGYVWFERESDDLVGRPDPETQLAAIAKLKHFITSLPDLYPVDPERVLLIGFSQGGAMCNCLALTQPELIIGVAALASFIPPLPETVRTIDSLAGFPVFIAHGTRDETIPVKAARQARDRFQALGADVTYGEHDVGHKMSSQGMKDLRTWVKARLGD